MGAPRKSFQRGSLRQVARAGKRWAWEFRFRDPASRKPKSLYLDSEGYQTKADAQRYFETFVFALNSDRQTGRVNAPKLETLLDRYIREEQLMEIKARRPGHHSENKESMSFATAVSYLSVIRKIRDKWGEASIKSVKPAMVKQWLQEMNVAPKTKGNIKALMHRLFEMAMLWEVIESQRNPMELVEVKGITKRGKKPVVLSVEQSHRLIKLLPQPFRMMAIVAQCLGLRVEEVLALTWDDVDLENLRIMVTRAVVHGRIQSLKTECSEDELPLDPSFAAALEDWKKQSNGEGLVFPSPVTGHPYHASPIQQRHLRPAGWCLVPCPRCLAAEGVPCREDGIDVACHNDRWERAKARKLGSIGWHTFRHTYRSWLDETGAPVGVQQKLMRHADIATTMNRYGNAQMEAKRKANSKVVEMVLSPPDPMKAA